MRIRFKMCDLHFICDMEVKIERIIASIVFIVIFIAQCESRDMYSSTYSAKIFSKNVTQLLDSLLANYDKRIRPGHGGQPTRIRVNMNVRSMGPFSEKKEQYSMQLYLRHVWHDSRLRFNKTDFGRSEFSMNWMLVGKIWKPDTFFINGKNSEFHKITTPNMFLRMADNGRLTWSMRLTVRATCKMHLRRYPLDTQICPLTMASYGYTAQDVLYTWDESKLDPVTVDSDVSLAQYDLILINTSAENIITRKREKIPTLTVRFHLRRETGFFILQMYVPCILIVFCSWVAFWITKKDVPGRVNLGVTTVLSITTIGFGGRATGPAVSYATALDYFVILCFAFVFAAVLEFAFINFVERAANKRRKKMEKLRSEVIEKIEKTGSMIVTTTVQESKAPISESLKGVLKVQLAAIPAAEDKLVTIVDEAPPGDTRDALKRLMKMPLTVLPEGGDSVWRSMDSSDDEDELAEGRPPTPPKGAPWRKTLRNIKSKLTNDVSANEGPITRQRPEVVVELEDIVQENDDSPITVWQLLTCKKQLVKNMSPSFILPAEEDVSEIFSIVDIYARRIFPLLFFSIMTLYWVLFNYYITDIFPGEIADKVIMA